MANDVFLTAGRRTPIGAFQGLLSSVPAVQLGAAVVRAVLTSDGGVFTNEITPVTVQDRKGTRSVTLDETPYACDIAKIPTLRPAFSKTGTVTAASSSSISDGAAAVMLM